jgi:DNA recombination-dependent growth factor C
MIIHQSSPKKAIVLTVKTPLDKVLLAEALGKLAFRECTPSMEESWGFVPPSEGGRWETLTIIKQYWVISLRHDRRVIGKSRLARERKTAIKKQAVKIGKALTKEERDAVTEDVKKSLLKFFPPNENTTQAIYCDVTRQIFILESSIPKAKFFVEKLDRALKGQNNTISLDESSIKACLADTLTAWLHKPDKLPKEHDFEVGKSMRLESPGNSAVLTGQESDSPEVREHLHAHKYASKVSLVWKDVIEFTLSSRKILSAIDMKKYCAENVKESKTECKEDINAYHEASVLIYMSVLSELWSAVQQIPEEL